MANAGEQERWDYAHRAGGRGSQEGHVTEACPPPVSNKGKATGTGVKAKLQVLGGAGRSIILSPNDLNWSRRPWGQGTRAENRAKAERQSKAQMVLKPGTSILVNIPRSAEVEPAARGQVILAMTLRDSRGRSHLSSDPLCEIRITDGRDF